MEDPQIVDELFSILTLQNPESFASRKYVSFQTMKDAEKMRASILGIVAEKLDPLTFDGTMKMYSSHRRINFRDIASRKTAVFLTVSDTDRYMDRMVSLFYEQALQELCWFADTKGVQGTLPLPVRLYLDDFATNCRIEDFDSIISVIRSRGIAVSVVLQSITQLEAFYGRAKAATIINGCDHILYLGGQDLETAQFLSQRANKTVHTILNMPIGTGYLFSRGHLPAEIRPYQLATHPDFPQAVKASYKAQKGKNLCQNSLPLRVKKAREAVLNPQITDKDSIVSLTQAAKESLIEDISPAARMTGHCPSRSVKVLQKTRSWIWNPSWSMI